MLLVILIVVLCLALLPTWPYSRGWGPYPSGLVGVVLIILLVWLVLGGRL